MAPSVVMRKRARQTNRMETSMEKIKHIAKIAFCTAFIGLADFLSFTGNLLIDVSLFIERHIRRP